MNPHQRAQLEARLKAMPKSEQDRLFKRAGELRREDQRKAKSDRRRDEGDGARRGGSGKRKNDPVRMYVLKLLAKEEAGGGGGREDSAHKDSALVGIAVHIGKRRCVVRAGGVESEGEDTAALRVSGGTEDIEDTQDIECRLPAALAGRQQSELCVGDRVAYAFDGDQAHLLHVLPRRTVLTRRDTRTGQRRAIAANIDAVVIVVSVVSPPLHPRLIDRYLLAIEDSWVERHGGKHADDPDPAQAVIAVNKVDLLDGLTDEKRAGEMGKLGAYRELGVPIVECSAERADGIDALRAELAGKTVVFVGHSGVGKSSLANALDERLGVAVKSIGTAANRGRHTTTGSQMYEIGPVPGGLEHEPFRVIDTPGIRFFGLDELTPAELRDSMPEFRELRRGCRFNDCTHTHEPGCAVRLAVEEGGLSGARYETYVRLLEEIGSGRGVPTERIKGLEEGE